jgi:hypothetical protein
MSSEKWRLVQSTFENQGLQATLLEAMGWLIPTSPIDKVIVAGETVKIKVLAQLPGASFIDIEDFGGGSTKWHRSVDHELKKYFPERITRYRHASGDSWYWPKKLSSGSLSYDRLPTRHDSLPDYLAQRLAGLSFSFDEHTKTGGVAPNTVKERIRGQFESGKVTSDFFTKFKQRHEGLASAISGLPDSKASSSYSTLILNRLMFIYFLQKKEFLNGDPDYLRSCLDKVQGLKGRDKFYNFYKDYLLELFFSKLDKRDGVIADIEIEAIAGSIPYINGGVFSKSNAEEAFDITIPDSAFEEIFTFFDSYTWHLDTRPTGSPKEINPEVIGYIFEQYINFTAGGKKEKGAYYTKHDVTGYMVGQTLVPRIIDEVVAMGLDPFHLLKSNPGTYIHESMKHGFDEINNCWVAVDGELAACWEGDPIGWSLLDDSELDFRVCLPEETWVEMFYRRERVEKLKLDLANGTVKTVNDLVTFNLNSQALLTDCIAQIESATTLEDLWSRVSSLSVIDPTCGSGAFLFAALEVLEDVYAHIADRIADVNSESKILIEVASHANRRYFLRKHAALQNIYGTDIMDDAIETAKLRIFLALASCLETKDQIEPLPDLDFNLKVGNLVVGFKDAHDVSRVEDGKVSLVNEISNLEEDISAHVDLFEHFQDASSSNSPQLETAKQHLENSYCRLKNRADSYYAQCVNKSQEEFHLWGEENKPFHWAIEFPQVFTNGGFDVVIGNPPYQKSSDISLETKSALVGYKRLKFSDFYEVCLERSISLLSPSGRFAMIVMSNFAFGSRYGATREMVNENQRALWHSSFGRIPNGLFTPARVRNSILVTAPGQGNFTTRHHIFNAAQRLSMFENLEFVSFKSTQNEPIIRGGVAQSIADHISESHSVSGPSSGENIYIRPAAGYWYPSIPFTVPTFIGAFEVSAPSDPGLKTIPLLAGESVMTVCALLGSKIAYLWWQSIGDDFHAKPTESLGIRGAFHFAKWTPEMKTAAKAIMGEIPDGFFASKNSGEAQINIRWSAMREFTDPLDFALLKMAGLEQEWRPLNIWYRSTMRSSGLSHKNIVLDREALTKLGISGKIETLGLES